MLLKIKNMLYMLRGLKSLRARIFILILAVGIIPSVLMRYGIVENYKEKAISLRYTVVRSQLKILATHLINYDYLKDTTSAVINAELEMLSNLYDGRVLVIGGNFKVVKDTNGISEGKTMIAGEVIQAFAGEEKYHYDEEHGYIEITTPIIETIKIEADGQEKEEAVVRGVMLTSISDENIVSTMAVMHRNALLLEVLMILVIVTIAYFLSAVLTKPFDRVTQAINDVQAGYTNETISVPDYVETVHIVDAFNQLLERMKVLDDSRQEFVANVSHELKTPLTSMKVLADSLLDQPEAPVELYREFLEDIAEEIDRENRIITDLLALVKMDKKVADMNIAAISINELMELILKRLRPIARKRDVEVVFESVRSVLAEVDEVKMTLVISNLVENAIKYNREHGWVKVLLDANHQSFIVEISDSGVGIPEDSLAHIYERFYRVDKSHSRDIGGTGLGLAITRSAVLMHRGTITVTSLPEEGTTFVVKIPLNYIAG